ncbi:hypothetical protein ALI144C_18950 [Actinosynnema sp. ALI-1.44]|uniref:STAS domain-containing protein n=1 Tax=Actinosynnema sp. ALI-1.44 TaxID=1933779 RepID=UPI00097C35B2|nr:STAS domain-containing protein [Actinosynnema sp. ALI-1.44]ONI81419.1 hypothetical protein ALI144C_18950 [Actinosynnema sp. ALI-1.44]
MSTDSALVSVSTSHTEDITVVHVAGELDMSSIEALDAAVGAELAARPRGVVIDMREVRFCGSSGLRVLLQTREQANSRQMGLRVVATSPAVLHVLEISGLAALFELRDSVPTAVAELAA